MGVSNYEHTLNTFIHLIHGKGTVELQFKCINTGANRYHIIAVKDNIKGIWFKVTKVHKSGRIIGTLNITDISIHGMSYDRTVIGNIPDSVSTSVRSICEDIYSRLGIHD